MKRCPHCGGGLSDEVGICPECGAPANGLRPNGTPHALEAEVGVLLAQANLSRLRRQFEVATTQCVEVLRRYPNNAAAHSLLGDICRDQGADADALGWYNFALQLDPTSAADRRKMAEVEARLRASTLEYGTPQPRWRQLLGGGRFRLPLGLVLGVAIGCLVLATLAFLTVERDSTRAGMLGGPGMPRALPTPLPSTQPSPAPAPSPPAVAPTPSSSPAPEQPVVYTPGGEPPRLTPPPDLNHSDREQRLLKALRASAAAEEQKVAVDEVVVDPRDGSAIVCITAQDVLGGPDARAPVLQKSLRVAELALAHGDKLARVTVRCCAPLVDADGVQREQLVFVGDVAAQALSQAVGHDLTFDQAVRLFDPAPWWHARLLPTR